MDYTMIKIENENQKSGLIIFLVLFHSACLYKTYCLKCFTELQTSFIYLFKGAVARKRKLFKFELRNVVMLEFNLWENIARNAILYYTIGLG